MPGQQVEARRAQRAIDVLREQIAPKATNEELEWLAAVGKRHGLDPIAGHIVLIPRYDGRLDRIVNRPQITADGRLVLADRTGELDGFTGPEWTGPRNVDGSHTWLEVWDTEDEKTKPYAARAFVYRRGRAHPANGTVRWIEFAQTNSNGVLLPTWRQMPSHMLGKVALSLAIRRAFPGIIPNDIDIEDDFASLEREPEYQPPAATHENLLVNPAAGDSPDDGVGADGPPGRADSVSLIEERVTALGKDRAQVFADWRVHANLPWPGPFSPGVAAQYERKLAELEAAG